MKKINSLSFLILTLVMSFLLVACNSDGGDTNGDISGDTSGDVSSKEITGVTFESVSKTYDGEACELLVKGELPDGVSVKYENNVGTDAGTYNAKATLSGNGYKTLVLEAAITINKATINGVSAEAEQEIKSDGSLHFPEYIGNLPDGISVKYIFNGTELDGVSAPGTYSASIVFYGKNYEELVLAVEFKIKRDLIKLATSVIKAFGSAPDVWEFLPESFEPENRVIAQAPDYTSSVSVSGIPQNGMGKQLNVVYDILTKAEVAVNAVNKIYAVMNTISELYTAFLDSDPEDYDVFTASAGGFEFTIVINDDSYLLSAKINSVNVTLAADKQGEVYGAHVQLTDTTALKYEVTSDGIQIALNILNKGAMLVEFERTEEGVVGFVYEFLGLTDSDLISTSAMIEVTEDYTIVIGTKGDFIPTSVSRNCEIYDNKTGELVGTKVREDVKGIVFNTYWFPLAEVSGINSISKIDKINGVNPDTIYINGYSGEDTIHTMLVGLSIISKSTSRRFDIEFKTMYFWQYDEEKGDYVSVSAEVPMIFIQEEFVDDFEKDFKDKNKAYLNGSTVTLLVTDDEFAVIEYAYSELLAEYDINKDVVNRQYIIDLFT